MIRFVLRFVGFLLLAAAFVAFLYDGTKTLAGSQVHLTAIEQTWANLHQPSLDAAQKRLRDTLPTPVFEFLSAYGFKAPTSLVLGILGALLMLIGRKKKPLIGYAR